MKHNKWVQRQNESAALLAWAQESEQVTIGQLVKKNHIIGSFTVIDIQGNDIKIENIDTTAQEWVTRSQIRLG